MKKQDLSIITVTFNNYDDLVATQKSVERFEEYEKVVVNGGSCERTREFLKRRPDIVSVSERDEGIADAFNKGVHLSKQKYITFLNSGDIYISDHYLKTAVEFLEQNPEIDYVHARILYKDRHHGNLILGEDNRSYKKGMFLNHQGLVVRKRLHDELGDYSKRYRAAMDYEWFLRAIKAGKRGRFLPIIAVEMDGNGISSTNEWLVYQEFHRAIKEAGLYDLEARLRFLVRRIKLMTKKILPHFVVHLYKRLRFESAN